MSERPYTTRSAEATSDRRSDRLPAPVRAVLLLLMLSSCRKPFEHVDHPASSAIDQGHIGTEDVVPGACKRLWYGLSCIHAEHESTRVASQRSAIFIDRDIPTSEREAVWLAIDASERALASLLSSTGHRTELSRLPTMFRQYVVRPDASTFRVDALVSCSTFDGALFEEPIEFRSQSSCTLYYSYDTSSGRIIYLQTARLAASY